MRDDHHLAGVLLGTALGDALGLPYEGLSARAIERRAGALDRFRLAGRTGFVSDDTEQAALLAQCLAHERRDPARCALLFRRALLGWFARLPWGIGLATLRACLRIAFGLSRSGVRSAGNGAAMRAAIVGAFFREDRDARLRFGRALAEVTHTDARAVDGALFVAELAALCSRADPSDPHTSLAARASTTVEHTDLRAAIEQAIELAAHEASLENAAHTIGTTGFVMHSVPLAVFCFVRFALPLDCVRAAIRAGGDTDSTAAIVGAWCGALAGPAIVPDALLSAIHDGPFGPTHLRALAANLADESAPRARYSWMAAMLRNLALYPVVLAHGFARLVGN